MRDHPAWNVAVHEAGHAIVSHAVGVSVGHVTIVPGEGNLGHLETFVSFDVIAPGKQLEILAAGVEAERLLCGGVIPGGARGDFESATKIVQASYTRQLQRGESVEQILDGYRVLAAAKVTQLKPHIERLAGELIRRGTIPGHEVPVPPPSQGP